MLPVVGCRRFRDRGGVARRGDGPARVPEKACLNSQLSTAMAPWRTPLASHDPGKILLDLAVAVALGGECLADIN